MSEKKTYYAIHKGVKPGVYLTWGEAQPLVKGFKGACYKKFYKKQDADHFVISGISNTPNKTKQTKLRQYFHLNNPSPLERYGFTIKNDKTTNVSSTEQDEMFRQISLVKPTQQKPWADFPLKYKILVFTDGSSITYNNNMIAGYGIHFPQQFIKDMNGSIPGKQTNQRAELYAILKSLKTIVKSTEYKRQNIYVYTDSMYSINCITKWCKKWIKNEWKTSKGEPVLNKDLIKPIHDIYCKHRVDLIHVKAHTGDSDRFSIANHKADRLAFGVTQKLLQNES